MPHFPALRFLAPRFLAPIFLALAAVSPGVSALAAASRPNIIVILADDKY